MNIFKRIIGFLVLAVFRDGGARRSSRRISWCKK